jgi:hypothetical protein
MDCVCDGREGMESYMEASGGDRGGGLDEVRYDGWWCEGCRVGEVVDVWKCEVDGRECDGSVGLEGDGL